MRFRVIPLMMAIALSVAAPAPAAPAQDPDPVATAQEHFKKGREAFKQGDFASARASFQRSQELLPTPGTLLNLALCEEQLGMIASAWQHFIDLTNQLAPSDTRYAAAMQRAAALEPRVPRLWIDLAPGVPPGTRVTRDKVAISGTNLGTELPVDPGRHVISVTAPGREERRYEVMIVEGKREAIKVEPGTPITGAGTPAGTGTAPATTVTAPPKVAPTSPPPPLPPPKSSSRRTAGFVIGGVGLAGLTVGGVTGVLTILKTNEVEGLCPDPKRCTTDGVLIADSARKLGLASTITFIVGAAGVGVGAFLVLTAKPAKEPEAVVGPIVLPGGAGFGLRGTF